MAEDYQKKYGLDHSIGQLTPTLCSLFSLRHPRECQAAPIDAVVDRAREIFSGGRAKKALIYNPDAIGDDMYRRYPELLAPVDALTDLRLRSSAVMASVTPVCFATIYTGAPPEVHGIQTYAKPVLKVETLFDVLAEAGLNVAIVSTNRCSIDTIFRERGVDYHSLRSDAAVFELTRRLLRENAHDVIVSYNGAFDSSVHHGGGPYSEASRGHLREAVERYGVLNADVEECWGDFDRVTVFAPDHGAHPQGDNGTHGLDVAEDMIVNHFYRLRPGGRKNR